MIREALYKKTVDILFEAYFNDTLRHSSCHACAVGNIVAANMKICYADKSWMDGHVPWWDDVFLTANGKQSIYAYGYWGEAKKQIDSTGYRWRQLAAIEFAFETAPQGNNDEDWTFNGLCAVLDTLKEIHQVDSNEQEVKRFTHHYHQKSKCTHP